MWNIYINITFASVYVSMLPSIGAFYLVQLSHQLSFMMQRQETTDNQPNYSWLLLLYGTDFGQCLQGWIVSMF